MESGLQKISKIVFALFAFAGLALGFIGLVMPLIGDEFQIWKVVTDYIDSIKAMIENSSTSIVEITAIVECGIIIVVFAIFALMMVISGIPLLIISITDLFKAKVEYNRKPYLKFLSACGMLAIIEKNIITAQTGKCLFFLSTAAGVMLIGMIIGYIFMALDERDTSLVSAVVASLAAACLAVGASFICRFPISYDGVELQLMGPGYAAFVNTYQAAQSSGSFPQKAFIDMLLLIVAGVLMMVGACITLAKSRSLVPLKEGANPGKGLLVGSIVSAILVVGGAALFIFVDKEYYKVTMNGIIGVGAIAAAFILAIVALATKNIGTSPAPRAQEQQ